MHAASDQPSSTRMLAHQMQSPSHVQLAKPTVQDHQQEQERQIRMDPGPLAQPPTVTAAFAAAGARGLQTETHFGCKPHVL